MAILKNTTVSDTGFLQLPVGTTAQRPTPANGQMRFNTSTGKAEFYNASSAAWLGTAAAGVVATGGTVYDVDAEGTTYRVHVFTNTGNSTFTVTQGGSVEYLIVAGGAGAGEGSGGGGGAGGLLTGFTIVTPQSYAVTVGSGGASATANAGNGSDGANSSLFGLTAIGGGGGGGYNDNSGRSGGSGGGAGRGSGSVGQGTAGQGNNGGLGDSSGAGGGGGGAGGAGGNSSAQAEGGIGISSSITGISNFYAGGGGAGNRSSAQSPRYQNPIPGGFGGGGGGQNRDIFPGTPGTPNTGGGGGGQDNRFFGNIPHPGGSGIVIVRYPLRQENPVTAAGKVVGDGLVLDLDFAKPTVYSGSGTVVNDSRLNGLTGTLFNISTANNIRTHRASLEFNESNQYVEIPNIAIPSLWDNNFTGIFWIKWAGATISGIFGFQASPSNFHFEIRPGGNLRLRDRDMSDIVVSSAVALNTWEHLSFSRTGNTYRIFKNGVEIGSRTEDPGNVLFSTTPTIGESHFPIGARPFNGQIALALIYNRSLSAAEIAQNFNATRWRFGV